MNELTQSWPLIGHLDPRSASDWPSSALCGLWELAMVCEASASLLAVENCEATVRLGLNTWD